MSLSYGEHIEEQKLRISGGIIALVEELGRTVINADETCKAMITDTDEPMQIKLLFKDGLGYRVEVHLDHEPEIPDDGIPFHSSTWPQYEEQYEFDHTPDEFAQGI